MVSKFNEVLPFLRDGDRQVGVCVMGPVGDHDNIIWIRAWAWQQNGDEIAASAGNAGQQVEGAHKLEDKNCPPFAHPDKERWMVQTGFEPDSAEFTHTKPVFVQAMALIDKNGERSIVQWSQAVALHAPEENTHGDGHTHDAPHAVPH
jgi:hypothetical protein